SMREYLRLLGVFFRISFQDDAAYRGEFWMRLLTTLYALAAAVVGLWILFSNTDAIAGWNIYEVLILSGTFHVVGGVIRAVFAPNFQRITEEVDRKSTRLNSSHVKISYAVFCLKKKK